MLDVCPDAVFECIGVISTQWDLRHPHDRKYISSKPWFDYFHITNLRFFITVNERIDYLYLYYDELYRKFSHMDFWIPKFALLS